ncbi:TetR family transcriptional regulator [Dietzia aerolata]|uniref:TetR family transcriptional regulator n=1 Tax=Dietzia aerolata TaxID=595984 RepID=A0ABV5JT80_9ACTN|nr:TetR family transcriptional regulator [Dietzia aerolata]MBB0970028.1 TetR family transcriptional regulator [Dietzia aerolata]
MTADAHESGRRSAKSAPGRPRDGRIDAAIISATRELILDTGYASLSLSAIAAHAGTTTAALYRRWSGKAELVHEAVLSADAIPAREFDGSHGGEDCSRDGGAAGSEIRALVETVRAIFDRPEVRAALPGLIADTVADPSLHRRMIARLTGNLPAFESRFGQTRHQHDELPMLAEVVAGTAIFRILVRRDAALDDAWVDELTEMITGRWAPGT